MLQRSPYPQADIGLGNNDPLIHLPSSTIVEHGRAQVIYGADDPSSYLYLVIAGLVQVARVEMGGRQVIVDVYRADDFFGEAAFMGLSCRAEQAVALEKTRLMKWTTDEIRQLVDHRPGLGMALLKVMTQREAELTERLQSLSHDSTAVRVARALMRFSRRLGTSTSDGTIGMRAFTHEFLAKYVCTSRELVNMSMIQFRREQLLTYSRKEITLRYEALGQWIRNNT